MENTATTSPLPSEDSAEESVPPPVSPIELLPQDAVQNVLSRLPLRDAVACRPVSRFFLTALSSSSSSSSFLSLLPPLRLLLLRHPRPAPTNLHAFDPSLRRWIRLPLSFLPFPSSSPIASSPSLLYLWVDPVAAPVTAHPPKSLAVCNPLAGSYRLLPPLGSAWSRHGTVLAGDGGAAIVLTELAALAYAPGSDRWLKYPLSLPSKPRSPILTAGAIFALLDVGTPWRSQWKLFSCDLGDLSKKVSGWAPLERDQWGDVFEVLKRPRLLPGKGGRCVLMIGGLRSSFAVDAPCSTVLLLRLDLETMEWDEAGRMPQEMYRCFTGAGEIGMGGGGMVVVPPPGNNKVKVFGGDGRVWFSGKRVKGKLAMWEEEEVGKCGGGGGVWSWVEGVPGYGEGVYRGFAFDAGFTAMP